MALKDRVTTTGYKSGWRIVKAMPTPVARTMFNNAADWAFLRQGKGTKRLESNLRRVLGPYTTEMEVRRVVRAALRSYSRYWMESFRLPSMSARDVVAGVHTHGEDLFREMLAAGNGLICALPHMANWDTAGAWAVLTGVNFTTVAERLEPADLFDQFVDYRESLGMEVLALSGGERAPFEVLAERLSQGRMLALLADRDLTEAGVEVDFFGAATKMPAGPALLAVRTGAPLMPVTLSYDDGGEIGLHIHFGELVDNPRTGDEAKDISVMTQAVADAFAEGIRRAPQDWHMLQRLWLDDLEPRSSERQ